MSQSHCPSQIPCELARGSTWAYKARSIRKQTQTDARAWLLENPCIDELYTRQRGWWTWLLDNLYIVQIYKEKGRQTGKAASQAIHSGSIGRSHFTWNCFNTTWKFTTLFKFPWWFSIWHRRSMAALIFCRRLAESDLTAISSVMCMDWLHWWHNHTSQHWPLLPKWVRNINMHHLVQSKWKTG